MTLWYHFKSAYITGNAIKCNLNDRNNDIKEVENFV